MLKQQPLNANAQRSIDLLVMTMLQLLQSKLLSEITVSELTQCAGVVRNTFYAHFDSKESILSYHLYDLFRTRIEVELETLSPETLELDLLYFEVCQSHIDFIQILHKNQLLHLLNQFGNQFNALCERYGLVVCCNVSNEAKAYADLIYADVLASIIKQWISLGRHDSPKVLSSIYREIVR